MPEILRIFIRLWRGEVSLGTTYWIFGAVVVLMFHILELVPLDHSGQEDVLKIISSLYYFFISIAIFRSSFKHKGSKFFIIYAQLSAAGLLALVLWRIFFTRLFTLDSSPSLLSMWQ